MEKKIDNINDLEKKVPWYKSISNAFVYAEIISNARQLVLTPVKSYTLGIFSLKPNKTMKARLGHQSIKVQYHSIFEHENDV